jgi:hypothetical protein
MARPRLTFDKTELVLVDMEAKKPAVHNLTRDDLVRFRLTRKRAFALYRFVEDEVLEFHVRGQIEPLRLRRRKNRELFDSYLDGTRKFCEANQVSFVDET